MDCAQGSDLGLAQGLDDARHVGASVVAGAQRDLLDTDAASLEGTSLLLLGEGAEDQDVVLHGLGDARAEGKPQPGIHDDAQQGLAARLAQAVGEQGIVGHDGADADHDGVAGMPQMLHVGARLLAGDPAAGGAAGAQG